MNICEDRHEPQYQVTYRPAKGRDFCPVWLVCESCLVNRRHFGSEDLIKQKIPLSEITA
jgi:hypothetical protein